MSEMNRMPLKSQPNAPDATNETIGPTNELGLKPGPPPPSCRMAGAREQRESSGPSEGSGQQGSRVQSGADDHGMRTTKRRRAAEGVRHGQHGSEQQHAKTIHSR